ncbi:MAG: pyridoxamine 5'-phosphate oxidase family protein [Porcipelethomonas sp.]
MRRSDLEVISDNEICTLIDQCKICRIAMNDSGGIYIVPLNFGYEFERGIYTFYFHSASKGRKICALKDHSDVAFEMDCGGELSEGKMACDYSFYYGSIIGSGYAEFIEKTKEKISALKHIMKHQTGKNFENTDFLYETVENTTVFKIVADKISCKQHK